MRIAVVIRPVCALLWGAATAEVRRYPAAGDGGPPGDLATRSAIDPSDQAGRRRLCRHPRLRRDRRLTRLYGLFACGRRMDSGRTGAANTMTNGPVPSRRPPMRGGDHGAEFAA